MPDRRAEPPDAVLAYDWDHSRAAAEPVTAVEINDETLREGLQSVSVRQPTLAEKRAILRLAARLGVRGANVGFPGAGGTALDDAVGLVETIAGEGLDVSPQCAARTHAADIDAVAEVARRTGVALEIGLFVGCSRLRRAAEGWSLEDVVRIAGVAVDRARRAGLRVLFVTEDTTRTHPDELERLYGFAVAEGVDRVCIADTVGCATARAAANITRFIREVCAASASRGVAVDWHGHNDRGLAVAAALAAGAAGAARLHGTALGVGERVGNAPIEQLLANLRLLGWADPRLDLLDEYVAVCAAALGIAVPAAAPVVGRDAFRTATGVHAAALLKLSHGDDAALVDQVYGAIPAAWLGRRQEVEVGPLSGAANVRFWLERHGLEPTAARVARVLAAAKAGDHALNEHEVRALLDDELSPSV